MAAVLLYPVPECIPVSLQVAPHGRHVVDGVGDDHLAPAVGILVDAVKVAPEDVGPAGVALGDGLGYLRHGVPGVDGAEDGQERSSGVPEESVGVSSVNGVDVDPVDWTRGPEPGDLGQHAVFAGRLSQALGGDQLPLVGDVSIVAVAVLRSWFLAEDQALAGRLGNGVVQGAAVGVVVLGCQQHQSVPHLVVGDLVFEIARVVELSERVDGEANGGGFLYVVTGCLVDDDDVEVGLVVPAAQGAGAE